MNFLFNISLSIDLIDFITCYYICCLIKAIFILYIFIVSDYLMCHESSLELCLVFLFLLLSHCHYIFISIISLVYRFVLSAFFYFTVTSIIYIHSPFVIRYMFWFSVNFNHSFSCASLCIINIFSSVAFIIVTSTYFIFINLSIICCFCLISSFLALIIYLISLAYFSM